MKVRKLKSKLVVSYPNHISLQKFVFMKLVIAFDGFIECDWRNGHQSKGHL